MNPTELLTPNEEQKIEKSWIFLQQHAQELIEAIGDLAYNTLAEFLEALAQELPAYQSWLQEASKHIREARRISKPFMTHTSKHKYVLEVQGKKSDQILTEISQKSDQEIQLFLQQLWAKIAKDAQADEARGRKKLSTELFSCAQLLISEQGDFAPWKKMLI